MKTLQSHNLVENTTRGSAAGKPGIIYDKKICTSPEGKPLKGLYNAWIWINNPEQYNSYTTDLVKQIILAFREASNDRTVVAVVFTGVGDKAFCTGGNTREYAEYYSGNPQEYSQYMRLFNDMVTNILMCEKPVICRVNGMRIGGGQEIGMACDFTLAQDFARFGQAGPKHGSAPIGGATDFLHLSVGVERAMNSLTLCEPWSAYQAYMYGMITEVVPALKVNGKFMPNPLVHTDRWIDDHGKMVYGTAKTGEQMKHAKELVQKGTMDLKLLDEAVNALATKLLHTFPNCTMKTINAVRQKKLQWWDMNRETNREWLALNMMTEAKAGFRAFNEGPKDNREVDFVRLRRLLADGQGWSDELIREISPQFQNA